MEVFGSAGTGVPPKQQVVDGQLTLPVALTLRQQLLHSKHQAQAACSRVFETQAKSEAETADKAPVGR